MSRTVLVEMKNDRYVPSANAFGSFPSIEVLDNQGIGVRRAPPSDSSLPRPDIQSGARYVPAPVVECVSPFDWELALAKGLNGKTSAALVTDTTRSTARR